ncbi:leucine-rich repeat-containing protein 59-like isoform X2 [Argiope bruennichi]|uniref:Leucine-rich repeat-containing protein 59 n=1 Tax=Argiope bruennichi TaxID=94029 RepID=A0A8T0FM06_ARGBR|nr:leucine-rich repeat-containing protein 59-like isoform X2 [Argiope bruennichi]KAF8791415.1 Leucine-rich repeat-containing protein 59 [Argiope bruennichi]
MSLRDKVEGHELDLSLNVLTEIPVKELAAASKATHLDLSCNQIQSIPNDFATLTHLVKIDLSKNKIKELPANFGNLINLQYLDLYGNEITNLPVSFSRLKNLKWLDLKNNPLDPKLKNVAGDCLNEKECQACARKVVAYMQSIESELEREKQKKLKATREKEAIERAKIERELEEQRRLKKAEKEKRKAESKAKREARDLQQNIRSSHERNSNVENKTDDGQFKGDEGKGISCIQIFMYIILAACAIAVIGYAWGIHVGYFSVPDVKPVTEKIAVALHFFISEVIELVRFYAPKVKGFCLKIIHRYMTNVTYFASQIEHILALYFH